MQSLFLQNETISSAMGTSMPQSQAESQAPPANNDYFLQKQLEMMLDIQNKKLTAEMAKLSDSVQRLEQEISSIRRALHEGAAPRRESQPQQQLSSYEAPQPQQPSHSFMAPQPQYQQAYSQPCAPAQSQPSLRSDGRRNADLSKPIDRTGVAPKDVAIDKFFYCGAGSRR